MAFTLRRGTNISHWLSQSARRGAERKAYFTAADVRKLADLGLDHLRLPVDEEQLWSADGGRDAEGWDLLDQALDWAAASNLRVIVDLHIIRSHYFNQRTTPALFTDPAALATFVDLWAQLSDHLRGRACERVAYELLNEPVAPDAEDWNRVAHAAFAELRRREPERTILLGSNYFNSTDTFTQLRVPDDAHTVLTFHYYHPMPITHYQAKWWDGGVYDGPVQYPGMPIPADRLARLDPALQAQLRRWQKPYGPEAIAADLAGPLAVRQRTGRPLYCGEFGCYQRCPQALRLAWYRDVAAVFATHDIAWGNWDYKGGFGLFDADGRDTGIWAALAGT